VSEQYDELDRLRNALLQTPPADDAPPEVDPDRIWAAVHGELTKDELAELTEQVLASPRAMERWRWALEMKRQGEEEGEKAGRPSAMDGPIKAVAPWPRRVAPPATMPTPAGATIARQPWIRQAAGLAAAMVLVVLAWQGIQNQRSTFRGVDDPRAILQSIESAPRDHFVLEWRGPEIEGIVGYQVVVTRGVDLVFRADGLDQRRLEVPEAALSGVPSGSTLLWTVEATLTDGTKVGSGSLRTRLD
jgi:hypothetical protein